MEDNGDWDGQSCIQRKSRARPARLKRFDLIRHLRGICGSYRCKQCAELGRLSPQKNGGICGQRSRSIKRESSPCVFQLIYSGGDELTEQTEAVIRSY